MGFKTTAPKKISGTIVVKLGTIKGNGNFKAGK